MNKVSIVVPVYNVEKYLKECIESLVNQTYRNLEIILIDDGSTDMSGKICDDYSKFDKRVKVLHQKNAGAANAKNAGLDVATGDFISFVDSDDVVELNWIETLIKLLTDSDADLAECAFDKFYINHYDAINDFENSAGIFTANEYLKQYLSRWTSSLFCNKLLKKDLTQNIRFRKERRCIDDEFYTYKVISNAKKIVRIDKVLYHYRQRSSSAVQSIKNQLQITNDAMELRVERYEWIKEKFPSLKKIYLENDVDFLLFFAKNSAYGKDEIEKYKQISKFYLKESLKLGISKKRLINSLKFLMCKPEINEKLKANTALETTNDCFE